MGDIEKLQKMVSESRRIVFFGGAGVSTESGIPDFRSQNGIYNQQYRHPPEEIVSHDFFTAHPEEFFEFYRDRMIYPDAKPNAAHKKLAELERAGKLLAVVTQNIDGLHQAAGSKAVYELHGSVHRNLCQRCGARYSLATVLASHGVPTCACGGGIRPCVVLYGEALSEEVLSGAAQAVGQADMLIIGGTSLAVYPASGLVRYFSGKHLVVINQSTTPMDTSADLVITGSIGNVLAGIQPG